MSEIEKRLNDILLEELHKQNDYFCDKVPLISEISTKVWNCLVELNDDIIPFPVGNAFDISYIDLNSNLHLCGGHIEKCLDSYSVSNLKEIISLLDEAIETIMLSKNNKNQFI